MKVLLLTRYDRLGASSRVRFLQFVPGLTERGFEFTVSPLLADDYLHNLYAGKPLDLGRLIGRYLRRLRILFRRRQYDLIWLEKEALPWSPSWLELLMLRGTPYVLDLDDAWFERYRLHKSRLVRFLLGNRTDVLIRHAALVVVGNNYLFSYAQQAGAKRVAIVPSVVDIDRYPSLGNLSEETPAANGRPVTIGWIGTPITARYLDIIASAFRTVAADGTCKLRIIGASVPQTLATAPTESAPWTEATEIADICEMDLGIMPLHDSTWERGKCGYKLLQVMAAGRPVICSPVGANKDLVTAEQTGLFASSQQDWETALHRLIADVSLRRRMGQRARQAVESKFSLSYALPQIEALLREALAPRTVRKILYVLPTLNVGGTEMHVVRLANEMTRRGWRVSVFCIAGPGPLFPQLQRAGVTVLSPTVRPERSGHARNSAFTVASASVVLLNAILRLRPDVISFYLPAAYLIGGPLAWLGRTPVRIMNRRSLNHYQHDHRIAAFLERYLHQRMTAVIGNSRSVVHELIEQEGAPANRVGLIYNGVDISLFKPAEARRPEMRAALGIAPQQVVLVIIANLIPYKGHRDLFLALGQIKDRLESDWRLLVIGRDDGIGASLRKLAAELKIADHIEFLGLRSDIPDILQASDIGLLCSHEEGFSNAVLEGMAMSLPMIVTNVGGNPEAVVDGITGIVVPPREPEHLADAILRLMSDPRLRTQLGTAARQRVLQHFSFERCVESYELLYSSLLDGRPLQQEF